MRQFLFPAILFLLFANQLHAQIPSLYTAPGTGYSNFITDTYVDAQGNTISCGAFGGTTDFDPGPGVTNVTPSGWTNMFVVKLDASGHFLWVKTFPMSTYATAYPQEMKPDAAGNIFITGYYNYIIDFDPGPAVLNDTVACNCSGYDFFVLKLDQNGNLIWSRALGGPGSDEANALDVDAAGNSYICGSFSFTMDFDPGPGTHILTANSGNHSAYYMKLDPNGQLGWINTFTGGTDEFAKSIRLDKVNSKLYIAGQFAGTNMDVDSGPGSYLLTSPNSTPDAFVLQTDTAGNFNWAYQLGGPNYDRAEKIGVSADHHAYIIGTVLSDSIDFDPGPGVALHTILTNNRCFIVKLDEAGNYCWHGEVGGPFPNSHYSIAFDSQQQLYMAGYFTGPSDLNPGYASAYYSPSAGSTTNVYISKLDTANGNLIAVRIIQGTNSLVVEPCDLEFDAGGSLYLSGAYQGTGDFDVESGTLFSTAASTDFFLLHSGIIMNTEENNNAATFALFPNPGNGLFTLISPVNAHEFGKLIITDLTGKMVYSEDLAQSIPGTEKTIDLRNEAAGMYFLSLEIDQKLVSQKLVIGH